MINWIIGGAIVIFTLYIVIRYILRLKKGRSGCSGCSGCNSTSCGSREELQRR